VRCFPATGVTGRALQDVFPGDTQDAVRRLTVRTTGASENGGRQHNDDTGGAEWP